MARRLATEYIEAYLELNEQQLDEFIRMFQDNDIRIEDRVLENGDRHIFLYDRKDAIPLTFRYNGRFYEFFGSCRIEDHEIAGVIQKAMKDFGGYAVVHRIYRGFTMEYHYKHGRVVKIIEVSKKNRRLVYEYKDVAGKLEQLYRRNDAENEIEQIKEEVDRLLDERLLSKGTSRERVRDIDRKLKDLSHRLFVLEA
ncbi:hypothetical protein BSNK01_15280 [Bacillaceae bacterium]